MTTIKICSTNSPVDPYAFLHITHNLDGSITRHRHGLTTPTDSSSPHLSVLTKDIPLNTEKDTWIRLYLPQTTTTLSPLIKLPIVLYYHGGGFIFLTADHAPFNSFCSRMSTNLNVLVASVSYRLAPEHRLPAAYDDAAETLDLIRNSTDTWLVNHGDLSRCVIMGDSSGGNIAYHSALAVARELPQPPPLKIVGVVLVQPYFGGVERTESELRFVNDEYLPLVVNDLMWELALPVGVDRDHEYCNPIVGGGLDLVEWPVLIAAVDGDPLFDKGVELMEVMKKRSVRVVSLVRSGYCHGVFLVDPILGEELFGVIRSNILSES